MSTAKNSLTQLRSELKRAGTAERAKTSSWFFKTGPGQYGEGDKFLGITVPEQRKIAKKFYDLIRLEDARKLLHSPYHEERFTALEILVMQFERAVKEGHQAKQKNDLPVLFR